MHMNPKTVRKREMKIIKWIYPIILGVGILWGFDSAQAITLGKTYDRTNYEEIQDLLIPPLLNWVKKGEFILPTGKLEFEWKMDDAYLQASLKNEDRYDVDKGGFLVEKKTGKKPEFYYGYPFPKIDSKDPKAAEKIMENNAALRFHWGAISFSTRFMWINLKGHERQVITGDDYLYFQNRYRGPIESHDNLLQMVRSDFLEPFDLRGVVSICWTYNDAREDTILTYIPMRRTIRRISGLPRSNSFLGSDLCSDDVHLWSGKNTSMTWKLIGQKTILVPFTSSKKIDVKENLDGSIDKVTFTVKKGFQVQGWQGASWAPIDLIWAPRPVWIIEAVPKDSSYNYGKQIFYTDQEVSINYFKEIYDKSGKYWKTVLTSYSYQVTPKGRCLIGLDDFLLAVDDKASHATACDMINYPGHELRIDLPPDKIGPQQFTESVLRQLSK